MATLSRRVGLLDGVVFSGGEPTLDPRLPDAVADVRALGLQAALHTAGIYPERLAALLPDLAWVGFDVKTDFERYDALAGLRRSGEATRSALTHLLASGVDHELRTTYHPAYVDDEALLATARTLRALGAPAWVLQRWRAHEGATEGPSMQWRWPNEALLDRLRDEGPALALR